MSSITPFHPKLMEGFVERCLDLGLDANDTEELFHKQANNAFLSQPAIHKGVTEGLKKAASRKLATLCAMHPDVLSLIVDCRVHYGDDQMSREMRKRASLPEPSWDNAPDWIKEAAAQAGGMIDDFQGLPLNQQIMIAALLGGGAGGVYRAINPSDEDISEGRGLPSRLVRGGLHGAAVGAGAGAGAATGDFVGAGLGGSNAIRYPMMAGGAMAGGMAADRLIDGM